MNDYSSHANTSLHLCWQVKQFLKKWLLSWTFSNFRKKAQQIKLFKRKLAKLSFSLTTDWQLSQHCKYCIFPMLNVGRSVWRVSWTFILLLSSFTYILFLHCRWVGLHSLKFIFLVLQKGLTVQNGLKVTTHYTELVLASHSRESHKTVFIFTEQTRIQLLG